MGRLPNVGDLKKKARERANWWLIIAAVGLLIDEYIKEGYFFHFDDVIIPATHENLLFWILIALLLMNIEKLRR